MRDGPGRDFAVLLRDKAVVNLWKAGDASWADRADLAARPVVSGAESFLAGTASCRIEVADVDALLPTVASLGGESTSGANDMPWGQRVAHILDPDGNTVNLTEPL